MLALCWLLTLSTVFSLKEIPERGRAGYLYKEYQAKRLSNTDSKTNSALIYPSKVDNFDEKNMDTFSQRYYVNSAYWDGTGPVFYEIGGEGTLSGPPGGYIETLGKEYGALLVALEHRFYGQSIPYGNATTENYQHLTVEQALADLAGFTKYYKTLDARTGSVPWFVFGGSYPGALASWYRAAYPDLSAGSLSSSGVVNCIIDYYQFDMQVTAAAGNECADRLKAIQSAFERTIAASPSGLDYALSLFHCEADMSQTDFFYMIADSWSMAIQYSSKSSLCDYISSVDVATANDQQIMQNFADFTNFYWGRTFCASGFYNTKSLADPTRWDVNSRSWRYQTCDQVSYFNTAPTSGSIRSNTVDLAYHLQQCAEVFGKIMFPSSLAMNRKYGGQFPITHNVFYSDFSDDPWQRASVWYPVASDQPYHLSQCDNCGHCSDFHAPSDTEPEPIKQSRQEFEKYLSLWLSAASSSSVKK